MYNSFPHTTVAAAGVPKAPPVAAVVRYGVENGAAHGFTATNGAQNTINRVDADNLAVAALPNDYQSNLIAGSDGLLYAVGAKRAAVEQVIYNGTARAKAAVADLSLATNSTTTLTGIVPGAPLTVVTAPVQPVFSRVLGRRRYELTDHQSNVSAVVGDRLYSSTTANGTVVYRPELLSYNDYYPFGMIIKPMSGNSGEYRFGFQGQEMDNDINETIGNYYTAQFWEYDARVARRWNLDPKGTPWESSYAVFKSNPISFVDILGDTATVAEAIGMENFTYSLREGYNGPISGETLGGWKASYMASDRTIGFKSVLFSRELEDGQNEYALVFAGTDDREDVKTDLSLYTKGVTQMTQALETALKYSRDVRESGFGFIGHSLGGWLASGAAMKTGHYAITLNAPGISEKNKSDYGLTMNPSIAAYVVEGEALSYVLSFAGLGASGEPVILRADYSTISKLAWYQRIENHKLGVMESKLKKAGMWQYKGQFMPSFKLPSRDYYIAPRDAINYIK